MKPIELALKAGRKRQSEITRFVHFCQENPESRDTIPVYENFCFVLALFRSRVADNILEGKALLERLLAFQVGGEFPVYLHEYPHCRYLGLKAKLYPVIFYLLRDFHTVLGDHLRTSLQALITSFTESKAPTTPEEWAEFLLYAQITGSEMSSAFLHWDPLCLAFAGPQKQERGEPAVTLYDIFCGEAGGKYSTRALQDHPVHLRAALVYPIEEKPVFASPSYSLSYQLWGSGNPTHSIFLHTTGLLNGQEISLEAKEVQEEMEVAFFINLHPDTGIFINGTKATSFQLGDNIQIISQGKSLELSFNLSSGEGQFWGHLHRGNRPGQLCLRGEEKFEAYDAVIGLRTVQRIQASIIQIKTEIASF